MSYIRRIVAVALLAVVATVVGLGPTALASAPTSVGTVADGATPPCC